MRRTFVPRCEGKEEEEERGEGQGPERREEGQEREGEEEQQGAQHGSASSSSFPPVRPPQFASGSAAGAGDPSLQLPLYDSARSFPHVPAPSAPSQPVTDGLKSIEEHRRGEGDLPSSSSSAAPEGDEFHQLRLGHKDGHASVARGETEVKHIPPPLPAVRTPYAVPPAGKGGEGEEREEEDLLSKKRVHENGDREGERRMQGEREEEEEQQERREEEDEEEVEKNQMSIPPSPVSLLNSPVSPPPLPASTQPPEVDVWEGETRRQPRGRRGARGGGEEEGGRERERDDGLSEDDRRRGMPVTRIHHTDTHGTRHFSSRHRKVLPPCTSPRSTPSILPPADVYVFFTHPQALYKYTCTYVFRIHP